MHDMAAMSHADDVEHHADHSPQKHHTSDCCKNMGHCAMGSCSLATANSNPILWVLKSTTLVVDFYSGKLPAPHISSLYRPPIFS
ncbi:hypothetical protein GCM10011613_11860 [Cellvibrio zantedeschiae]|uniref:Uncharacterized protein n=2 Tax=Cellvibrio zantedeschiae TaxID=1237077 RepID=A0ABQ3AZG8_9GAMM|nr:hypothetical protein GCM10011613_11860 [Cellvibrio zantedeschiae]